MGISLHLDGATVRSEADFHEAVRRASAIDWYGANVDALWDLLTNLVEQPIDIRWVNAAASREGFGPRFDPILAVLREAREKIGHSRFALELDL